MTTEMIEITLPDGEVFELPSYIDAHGVRRYVRNAVVDTAFDEQLIDLNKIAYMCQTQNLPLKDRIIFWSMLGYSVDGMCDLHNTLHMDKCKIVTLEWTSHPCTAEDDEE